ncbi:ribonuclease H-like domain-containing protein [Tanacetum coccineum]
MFLIGCSQVMAAPIISILSDSSKESVGSHVLRVILFGTIPTSIPVILVVSTEVPIALADPLVAPKVGAVFVISPTGVLDLVDYSSSFDSNPSEYSLPVTPELPLVSPFLCSDDSEADNESEPADQRARGMSLLHHHLSFHLHLLLPHPVRLFPSVDLTALTLMGRILLSTHLLLVHLRTLHQIFLQVCTIVYSLPTYTTSESSLDSSSKRSIAPALADLLPRKRFRDSNSPEVSGEEHMETGIAATETITDLGISDGVRAPTEDGIDLGVEVAIRDTREDEEEFEAEASAGGTIEIVVDPLATGGISESIGGDIPDLEGPVTTEKKYKDAQTLFTTIQTRFGGNEVTKKTQKTLLKKMYENFYDPSKESLDSIFNRLQKIVTQLVILGENISQEDLNLKFLRSLPSEWNSQIIEQEVNRTANSSSSSSSQNMAFVSSPSSTNEVNTAYGVSTANTQVSPASTQVSTASTQDLEQIHKDDIEEMDLKWQLALMSMRKRRFFKKTGRKITINGSDTAGYDKSKVECFNCHKMGYFARECRGPRNQDNSNRNQDNSRKTVIMEEISSKAMLAIDGVGFDWSYMADDEVPINMALMDFLDSEVHNDKTCSKTCLKSIETLKTQLDDLRIEFNKSEFNLSNYKRGLASVEEQLIFYKKNEVIFCEKLDVLKRDISYKDSEISMLKSELEKLKQEKESNQLKIENFDNASKSLDKLIGSQIPDKEEFQQPEFEGYLPKPSKSVSEDIFNEVKESPDAPMVEELVSDDKLEKKTIFPTVAKIEFVRPKQQEKPVRKPVKYTEMYRSQSPRPKAVNTARPNSAVVNAVRVNQGHLQKEYQGYVDSGCSRHMTGNMSYLSDFKEFDRGYVTFGGGAKGGKITGKGTLKTGKLDFEDVYFVKELQFNLFSVSQMCDKKNSVLFTDTACFVLSPDFKLPDESQVLLKVPRKNNMYSVDIKNIVPKESLTVLLQRPHLMNQCFGIGGLVIYTWVFFLATKDETSGILKRFITKIENLVDKKVKIIRCDNGTEFKNKVMSEFYEKGIEMEFSVARTPQQNGVAERRNRKLIEAARTMLADSKLPTIFWAEAVNTACYVHNRVLVVKPHNKTPYELFRGRTPALSFMRPFGCHVTILNTLDYLCKFDGKSDEGFFVGYSLNSKDFRVYNIRTRKVEENLHIRFLEGKTIIAGDEPKWLFDIDVITKSINYVPVVAGTNSNDSVGIEESVSTGHSSKETGSSQDYILKPLWKDGVSLESGIDDHERPENSTQDVNTVRPSINTASTKVNTGSLNINTVSPTVTTAPLEATYADFFGDEIEVDMSNITTTCPVPSTPNTRIHKDHSLDHMIGDIQSGVLTRRMTKASNEKGVISAVYEGKTHKDLYTCLFAYFLSHEEPKKVIQALKDPS